MPDQKLRLNQIPEKIKKMMINDLKMVNEMQYKEKAKGTIKTIFQKKNLLDFSQLQT
jgi:hypothetical protein